MGKMSHKIVAVMIALVAGCCTSSRRVHKARALLEEQEHEFDGKEPLEDGAHDETPDPERKEGTETKPSASQTLLVGLETRGKWTIEDKAMLRESKLFKCCKNECCVDETRAKKRDQGYFHNVMSCSGPEGCPEDKIFHEVEA